MDQQMMWIIGGIAVLIVGGLLWVYVSDEIETTRRVNASLRVLQAHPEFASAQADFFRFARLVCEELGRNEIDYVVRR